MIRPSGRRGAAALVALPASLVLLILPAAPAQAHASVIATEPANGAQLATAPTTIRVTFDEPVVLPSATGAANVIDENGERVDAGRAKLSSGGRSLTIGVGAHLPRGTYIASWSVVSADTHPVGGSIKFGYGMAPAAISIPASSGPSAGWELAVAAGKVAVYVGLIIALGLIPAAMMLGAGGRERQLVWHVAAAGVIVAAAGSVAQVVVQYLWQSSATPAGASWTGLLSFAGSSYAAAVWIRLGLLAAGILVLPGARPAPVRAVTRIRWTIAGLLAAGVLGSVVVNGHGGGGGGWRFASTLLHVTAVTAWLGGLGTLGWLLLRRRITGERLRHLPRWSRYAASAVTVLMLSGLVQALVEVRYPGALLSTTYGYLLLAKVLLVAAAIALGIAGHRWVRGQVAAAGSAASDGRPAPGQTARLRARVRAEAAVGVLVVVLSGALSSITPAVAAYAPQEEIRAAVGPYTVTIGIAPTRRGPESFRVVVLGSSDVTPLAQSLRLRLHQSGGPVRALQVTFPYRLPGAIRPGTPTPTTFSGAAVAVPVAGAWTGTLTVVAGRLQQYTAAFDFRVH